MPCQTQVEWLKERIQKVPVRLVFESALELMGTTQLGSFKARQPVFVAQPLLMPFPSVTHFRWPCRSLG